MTEQNILKVVRDSDRVEALRLTGLLDTGADEAFDRITRLAVRMIEAPMALVSLVDHDHQFIKSCSGSGELFSDDRRVPLSDSFCKHAVAESSPIVIEDTSQDERVVDNPARGKYDIRAYLGIPLTTSRGHTLGSLCVLDQTPREWPSEAVRLLRDLAQLTVTEIELRADLIERRALESELKYRANHDSLTDLANRNLLWTRLAEVIEETRRTDTAFAVFYLDLDHFKAINDNFGHVVGDELLQVVARRLESVVRESDTLARLGGDEFVGVLEQVQRRDQMESILERILESLSQPIGVEDHDIEIEVSIGVVLFRPDVDDEDKGAPADPQELIRRADAAMYRAKEDETGIEYSEYRLGDGD